MSVSTFEFWYTLVMNIIPLSREYLEETIKMANEIFPDTSEDPNEARAQELYEKLGFKIVGEEINTDDYKTLYREKNL